MGRGIRCGRNLQDIVRFRAGWRFSESRGARDDLWRIGQIAIRSMYQRLR